MLPFHKPRKAGSVVSVVMHKDSSQEPMHEEGEHPQELVMAMDQLIQALHNKDANKASEAFRAAFECLEAYPHVEGEENE